MAEMQEVYVTVILFLTFVMISSFNLCEAVIEGRYGAVPSGVNDLSLNSVVTMDIFIFLNLSFLID